MEQGADISDRPLSAEMRAQMVADAVGKISDGDPRKRVFDAALHQIRNAVAIATGQSPQNLGGDEK